jgi:hypothetical protein
MSSASQIMVLSYQSKLVDVCHYFCYQRLVLALFLLVFARLVFIRLIFTKLFFSGLDGRRRQQGASAFLGAAPTRVFSLELFGHRGIDHQAVVVTQLFARQNIAACGNKDTPISLIRLAVGFAGMVDPARRITPVKRVNYMLIVDMEVEGVVGVCWIMRMAAQRLFPSDDLAHVLDDGLALRKVSERKDPLTMHA